MPGDAQLSPQIEQVVLHFGETACDRRRQRGHAQDHADRAVGLIDGAVGFNPQVFLRHARPVAEARAAVIAGARIDFAKPVAHRSNLLPLRCDGSTRFANVASMRPSPELQAALDAAEQAARIARSLFQHNIEVRIKEDKSPVTEADVRCEIAIREIIESRFPSHGFYGEETGCRDTNAESLWLVDPIDGTKAFVREYAMFSTQIALIRRGEIVLGVSSAPVYGELAYAERGSGAYLSGQALAVSQVSTLESA